MVARVGFYLNRGNRLYGCVGNTAAITVFDSNWSEWCCRISMAPAAPRQDRRDRARHCSLSSRAEPSVTSRGRGHRQRGPCQMGTSTAAPIPEPEQPDSCCRPIMKQPRRCQTGRHKDGTLIHTGLCQYAQVDENDVGHGQEGGQACPAVRCRHRYCVQRV